jgi:phosphoserine phosphatase
MAQVLVLTAAAGRGLPDAEIEAVARAAGGGACRRLGRAAAEIALESPADLARLRARHAGIDLNVLPAGGRRKRLLIADMDSTIIPVECIDELADYAGVKAEVSAITARAMAGELDFEGALRARLELMLGLPESVLERVFAERIRLNPGARTLVRTMAAHGAHTALVSGGFSYFTERVAAAAGFAEQRANHLIFRDGRLAGVAEPIQGREAKLAALTGIAARLGIAPADAIAVGDGANDLAMIEAAGLGVAYRAKPALEARAKAVIRHGDLTALLHLQGYAENEFRDD